MKSNSLKEILGTICLVLFISEILLVIISWLLSAMQLEGVRSLLSSEGIRWLLGSFSDFVSTPLLVWGILLLSAFGCLQKSGVTILRKGYRSRIAFRVAFVLLGLYIAVLGMLTLMPHAILLSATGELFPSAFSRSLIPFSAFGIIVFSVAFGMMSGKLKTLGDILNALSSGIAKGAPLIILYILFIQFYESLWFVFG